jgi:hypothetical protein
MSLISQNRNGMPIDVQNSRNAHLKNIALLGRSRKKIDINTGFI